jgi:hypothetical protein
MKALGYAISIVSLMVMGWIAPVDQWITEKNTGYSVHYTATDREQVNDIKTLTVNGIDSVTSFFNRPFKSEFNVFIHPGRNSLDSTWQKEWNMPTFKSACWMVASGVADRIDVLSPKRWEREACEHTYADKSRTQQLITHELTHVFHGQQNASPDFSDSDAIDWFVEGLATFVSGQCDSRRMTAVVKAIKENQVPESLDEFWTGANRYGLSGSIVMYIDHTYGRAKLFELLPLNKKKEILTQLNTTESELLKSWKTYMLQM